jgi:hypothetical protein
VEAANLVSELLMICGVAGVSRLTREAGKRREVRGNESLRACSCDLDGSTSLSVRNQH